MKKVLFALFGAMLAFGASAATFTEGKQYQAIEKPVMVRQKLSNFSHFSAHTATTLNGLIKSIKRLNRGFLRM